MGLDTQASVTVGILSDTHIPYRMKRLPVAVFGALRDVDVILHAGDLDRPAALEPLQAIAPTYAVRGNVHILDLSSGGVSLPPRIELRLAGCHVLVTHGCLPGLAGVWYKGRDKILGMLAAGDKARFNGQIARRLVALHPRADVIIFGHTHRAHVERVGDALVVNPGAVCPTPREQPTVARLILDAGAPRVEIVPIE